MVVSIKPILVVAMVWAGAVAGLAGDRALVIGIDEYKLTGICNPAKNNLANGCIPPTPGGVDDAKAIAKFIERRYGFPISSIKQLTGADATAANIRQYVEDFLIGGTKPGDRVFFHFSGHGTRVPDKNGDEVDELDEAFVPYDADPLSNETKFILDDDVVQWIRKLKGRRVVMTFDSCNSGTISRGSSLSMGEARFLPPVDSYKISGTTRGIADVESLFRIPADPDRRDRGLSKETAGDESQSEVVVISAATEYQQAFPIKVDGRFRGAFSYLFEKVQDDIKDRVLSPQELERRLREGMADLTQRKLLSEQRAVVVGSGEKIQRPTVEIYSDCAAGEMPLFQVTTSPTCRLAAKSPNLSVSIALRNWRPFYFAEEQLEFDIKLGSRGYLTIVIFSEGDQANCIFPSKENTVNPLSAGIHRFPFELGDHFTAVQPFGRDIWVALVTKEPLNLRDEDKDTWGKMIERIGLPDLARSITRSSTFANAPSPTAPKQLKQGEWAATTMVVQTRER